ncbi:transcription initiation factor TFIIH subunit 3 [Pancytospora epiphaga]|nr:transcription initiation factor TFIIH subunit 3 [Pancytospora epiphaga]
MLICVLLDLNKQSWCYLPQDSFSNLLIYLQAIKRSSPDNTVYVINSRSIIWSSQIDDDFSKITRFSSTKQAEELEITPNDLGYALILKPNSVLIYNLAQEAPEHYLKYLKCTYTAQKYRVRIDAFCGSENTLIKMCCRSSGGTYLDNNGVQDLLGLLGNTEQKIEVFRTRCFCCNKCVQVGLVCPICLAIYCKFLPVCKRCKTKFTFTSQGKIK